MKCSIEVEETEDALFIDRVCYDYILVENDQFDELIDGLLNTQRFKKQLIDKLYEQLAHEATT